MDSKKIVIHRKGKKHLGKTDWSKLQGNSREPVIDVENPELAFSKHFKKAVK